MGKEHSAGSSAGLPLLVLSSSRTSAGTGNARAMDASDARGRDVGEAVVAALHPLRRSERPAASPAGRTSGHLLPHAPRLSRTLVQAPFVDRIKCDNRVNVSRVKEPVDDCINQT